MATFELGQVIRGKYRIERVLGEGGMGVVVAAQHVALDQRVAIKFLRPAMLANASVVARFAREARAASKIESDHVARVIDVDTLEDGAPFMVMEYLEGGDLSSVRKQRQPLPVNVAAGYVIDACEAIGEAHGLGIVHRDIKPANLFLARRGGGKTRVKVLDFGISKMASPDASEPSVTSTTSVMGSAEYMSPEQMRSLRDVDPRTDIWALGVTLYELVTARMPFPGETITQVCALVMSHHPAPPSTLWGGIPAAFDAVVLRCLEKDRERRYGSIAELADALAPFVMGASSSVNPPTLRPSFDRLSSADRLSPGGVDPSGGTVSLPPSAGPGPIRSSFPSNPQEVPASMSSPPMVVTGGRVASTTGAVSSRSAPLSSKASRAPLLVAAVVCLVVLGGGAAVFLKRSAASPPITVAPASSAIATEAAIAPSSAPAAEPPTVVPSAQPTAAPEPPASEPSSSADVVLRRPVPIPPSGRRPGPQPPPPVPVSKPNCNPPFTVDAKGLKHAKPECT